MTKNASSDEPGPKLIRHRMRFESNFTQIPNAWLRDERVSYRARGIRDLLLSHEHGWTITLKNLAAASPREGIDAVRGAVVELEEAGYLKRHIVQGRGGKFEGHDWELCDPFDLGATTLFTALDNPTRSGAALDKPTRTALDNPTPIRTPVRTSKKSSRGESRSEHYGIGGRRCTAELVDERHCALGHLVPSDDEAVAS
jgi:hypothetical protein